MLIIYAVPVEDRSRSYMEYFMYRGAFRINLGPNQVADQLAERDVQLIQLTREEEREMALTEHAGEFR